MSFFSVCATRWKTHLLQRPELSSLRCRESFVIRHGRHSNQVRPMEPFFQQSWLFKGLPQSVMQNIYALGEVVEIRPGEILISEGTFSGYLFFIIDG